MRFLITVLNNPFTQWCKWVLFALWQQFLHRKQHLLIRYGAHFSNVRFGRFNTLYDRAFLTDVVIDDYSYVGRDNVVACADIGKFTCLAPEVIVGMPNHPSRGFISAHPAFYSTARQAQITFVENDLFEEFKRVTIGHDVWIGTRAIVMGGVTIGNGAIVGAGAVVTKDVPPYAVVAGIPARVLRYRFEPEQIRMLEKIEWWNQDLDWLKANAHYFHRVNDFFRLYAEEKTSGNE
jgi:acetyltransferase-like isoleucine patch superfamily enzyme